MSVILTATQSSGINDVLVNLINTDRDKAIEFITLSGRTNDEAIAYVVEIEEAIDLANTREELKEYFTKLLTQARGFIADLAIPDRVVEEVEVKLTFKLDAGWVVNGIRNRLTGETRTTSLLKRTLTDSKGKSRSRVPVPDKVKDAGYSSWSAYLEGTYPEAYATAEAGSSYSAPRLLSTLEDETYLAAKDAADAGAQEEA